MTQTNFVYRSIISIFKKVCYNQNSAVGILLLIISILYCFLATFPKHGDFYAMNYASILFSQGYIDFYKEILINQEIPIGLIPYPPTFFIIEGLWLKFLSLFFGVSFNTIVSWDPSLYPINFPLLGIIPYLGALFLLTIISYFTLKNKWVCFVCFGTFSFVSIIIMGQIDIFCSLLIYASLIFFIRSITDTNSRFDLVLSYFLLGISMTFKPFGGLLLPVYLIFTFYLLKSRISNNLRVFKVIILLLVAICLGYGIFWLPYSSYFIPIISFHESEWLFNLQLSPVQLPPYHIISIWLLGNVVILYDLWNNSQVNDNKQLKNFFIFYIFTTIAWFFISVYTHPQWWILLIPPLLLVLDNFHNNINYVFYITISVLFLFYSLQWVNNIDLILKFYIPTIQVSSIFSIVNTTLIFSILLIWIFELRKTLFTDQQENNVHSDKGLLRKFAITLPVCLIIFLFFSQYFYQYLIGK